MTSFARIALGAAIAVALHATANAATNTAASCPAQPSLKPVRAVELASPPAAAAARKRRTPPAAQHVDYERELWRHQGVG